MRSLFSKNVRRTNTTAIEISSQINDIQKQLTQLLDIIVSYKAASNAQSFGINLFKIELTDIYQKLKRN